MTTGKYTRLIPRLPISSVVLGVFSFSTVASAHTVEVCWHAEVDQSITFYAGTYHEAEGEPQGGMIIDGSTYAFTGSLPELPPGVSECQPRECERPRGSPPAPAHWQTVNVPGLDPSEHSFSPTKTSGMEAPWIGCYPQFSAFGSCPADDDDDGACDDTDNCPGLANPDQADWDGDYAGDLCDPCPFFPEDDEDGDGVCGDIDICPDTSLPEGVPTHHLGINRFADVDGDGLFETVVPRGTGPLRSYTMDDTAGCSCAQIIEAQSLDEGHTKFGCSIGAMDTWVTLAEAAVEMTVSARAQGVAGSEVELSQEPAHAGGVASSCRVGSEGPGRWAMGSLLGLWAIGSIRRGRGRG